MFDFQVAMLMDPKPPGPNPAWVTAYIHSFAVKDLGPLQFS